jgi:glycosyltransferase involved in cell wall biosynthesis
LGVPSTRGRSDLLDLLTTATRIPPSPETSACDEKLSVAWLGPGHEWFESSDTRAALDGIALSVSPGPERELLGRTTPPDVLHVIGSTRVTTARLRSLAPESAIVLDLRNGVPGGRRFHRLVARQSQAADLVVVGSRLALRETRRRLPQLAERFVHLDNPMNLDRHAPPEDLGNSIDDFRDRKGLARHVVLYAGPFAARGGLDAAVEAVAAIRSMPSLTDLVRVALLDGECDRGYLKRCVREAARVGVPLVVEEAPSVTQIPFWYAAADIVCLPSRDGAGGEPARLAAAAARPIVGSEVDSILERIVDGETGVLVPVDDHQALVEVVGTLLTNTTEARRLGSLARRQIEAEAAPAVAAARLRRLWATAVRRQRGIAYTPSSER